MSLDTSDDESTRLPVPYGLCLGLSEVGAAAASSPLIDSRRGDDDALGKEGEDAASGELWCPGDLRDHWRPGQGDDVPVAVPARAAQPDRLPDRRRRRRRLERRPARRA